VPLLADWVAGKGEAVFALRVRGESMVNAHIVDGDVVLVRRQETAEPGDIVVALLDDEATVKRFAREGDALVLMPEHPTLAPIVVAPGQRDVKILGKVIGVFRDRV
jgi:repressor LexA